MSGGGRTVMGFWAIPRCGHSDMISASGTFCQKIHRQVWCSVYQPSSEAEMLSDNSRLRAYSAMPKAQYLGGVLINMKLSVNGMKHPEARPPRNCSVNSMGKLADKGVRSEMSANAMD